MITDAGMDANTGKTTVYKWHKRYREGRESLCDDAGRGRPKLVNSDIISRVNDIVNEDRRVSISEICDRTHLGYGTVQRILTDDLGMHRVSARWIPRMLSADDMTRRVAASTEFLRRYDREGDEFLRRIVTTDETWLFHYDPESKQQSSQWKRSSSPPPLKAKVVKSAKKNMFIFFMDSEGMILSHAVPEGQTVTAAYYSKVTEFP